jgi:hypothetical protein
MDRKIKKGDKKKTKNTLKKDVKKNSAKVKVKKLVKKSAKAPAKKTTIVSKKKSNNINDKVKIKNRKRAAGPVKRITKSRIKKENKKPVNEKIPDSIIESSRTEPITHGEGLHFIPLQGQAHPVSPIEAHQAERIFHHREETTLHQENRKVKEAMASRKNAKRYYRILGKRQQNRKK